MGTLRQTVGLYLTILRRYRPSIVTLLLLAVVAILAADIVTPYLVSRVFAALAKGSNSSDSAMNLFWFFVLSSALGMTAWRIVGFWAARRQAHIVRDLEQFVFDRLTQHSYTFFTNKFGGALVTQARRFVRSYQSLEDDLHFSILPMVVRLTCSITVLLISIPTIGLALLVWSAFYISSVVWMVIKKQPYTLEASATDTALTGHMADVVTNILTLKSFGRRRDEIAMFENLSGKWWRTRIKSWTIDEWVWSYSHVLGVAFSVVTLWLSIWLVGNGTATVATVLLAQFYITRVNGDLSQLQGVMNRVSRAFSDAAEMTAILTTPLEVKDILHPRPLAVSRGEVKFSTINFAYRSKRPVFDDFSLTIEPGERVGLVGPSGSGKTTLIKLLLRFLDVQSGVITLDGQDIRLVAQDDLRAHIAYVPQEPLLFHRSLLENIRYSRPTATDAEVRRAAELAHAAEFIEASPEGYNTLVGERGIKLSGGEKQRVAIARTMLSAAPIMVLDEATSSLDSKTEELITDGLASLMQQRTTIAIAHRLSTIRNLDRIVVMSHGRIVGQGSHPELLISCSLYKELWDHQTGGILGDESEEEETEDMPSDLCRAM